MPEDHGLEFDGVISHDRTPFTLLPPGAYQFSIQTVEKGLHQGSAKIPKCNRVTVTLEVYGDNGAITTIKDNLYLHTKTEGKLCEFFTAIGLRKYGESLKMTWDIQGKSGYAQIKVDTFTGRDGEPRQTNRVDYYLDPLRGKRLATERAKAAAASEPSEQLPIDNPDPPKSRAWTPGGF